jgi:hypothetical protein
MKGGGIGDSSSTHMAAQRNARWRILPAIAAGPKLLPRLASLHLTGPNAPAREKKGWLECSGHGERPHGGTPVRPPGRRSGNAASPLHGSLHEDDEEVEKLKAKLWTWFGRWWRGGELVRAHRSTQQQWRLSFSAYGASAEKKGTGEMSKWEGVETQLPVNSSLRTCRGSTPMYGAMWRRASTSSQPRCFSEFFSHQA